MLCMETCHSCRNTAPSFTCKRKRMRRSSVVEVQRMCRYPDPRGWRTGGRWGVGERNNISARSVMSTGWERIWQPLGTERGTVEERGCISNSSPKKENQQDVYGERERYYKELVHVTLMAESHRLWEAQESRWCNSSSSMKAWDPAEPTV